MQEHARAEVAATLHKRYVMINSFEIKRYRCFSSVSARNLSRVNIIVGQSGSGKTALLEALWLCAGGNPTHYFNLLRWRGLLGDTFQLATETYDQFFRDMFYKFRTEQGIEMSLEDTDRGAWTLEIGPDRDIGQQSVGYFADTLTHTPFAFRSKDPSGEAFIVSIQLGPEGTMKFPRSPNPYQVIFLNNVTLPNAANVTTKFSTMIQEGKEKNVIEGLNRLYKNITDIRLISYGGGTVLLAEVEGLGRIPITSVSGGINKYLTLLITLGNKRRNVVLVDEFENGLYYANLTDAWRGIVSVCRETDSQIFLTTHSRECLKAMLPILEESPDDFTLIRTERQEGEVLPVQFSGEEMRASLKQHFEIR